MILIGYQGIKGSNSEIAAMEIAKKNEFKDVSFIPLVSSFNVLESLRQGVIDFGVIAMYNNTGGYVKESEHALKYIDVEYHDEITLPIEHHLFVKNKDVLLHEITQISSHLQALVQCQNNLNMRFPKIPLMADEDTATAAMKLRLDLLPETTGVLCRKEAGIYNQLHLIESHLEDRNDNTTTFHMYK
jgi:prephenate dehydratase